MSCVFCGDPCSQQMCGQCQRRSYCDLQFVRDMLEKHGLEIQDDELNDDVLYDIPLTPPEDDGDACPQTR